MPLDFRSREEEGFSIKRFLKSFGAGVAVFLAFMAVGYYLVGPRITISDEGRLQLRITSPFNPQPDETITTPATHPMPKVEVYEKLSPEVTAGTGVIIGSREVAPFDYERYKQKRRERKPRKPAEDASTDQETPPTHDEYFVPDESDPEGTPPPDMPVETPGETPSVPASPAPAPAPEPANPPTEPSETALYRVQIGVYGSRENANHAVQALSASGFAATIVPFQRDGKTLYRVQVLVTHDKAKADTLKSLLESKGFPATVAKMN